MSWLQRYVVAKECILTRQMSHTCRLGLKGKEKSSCNENLKSQSQVQYHLKIYTEETVCLCLINHLKA